ncbi:MAG: ABC transporter ATP-binding protein [Eggerthellaceae bacterium]|nr:ABC transporter ATP-binding protein [Eggerthellaceae bacterium]
MSRRFSVLVEGLRKQYGNRVVLSIDSLALDSGVSYALIGSNGSGKTTLLRALAGTSKPNVGVIDVSGVVTRNQVRVGYMPQKPYVFGYSVEKNVAMAIASAGLPKQEVDRRVADALSAVGMGELARARGNTLSGGEAQRVALARILVSDLDVMLLDEPTASMDIAGTLQVESALADYRLRTGCLMLVATHAPAQAKRIADQAIMLHEGRLVEQGAVGEVLEHPVTEEGRSFLSYWQL